MYINILSVVRYEDFCLEPFSRGKSLFSFLGLGMTSSTRQFLTRHTDSKIKDQSRYSTYRDTQGNILKWTKRMKFEDIQDIQNKCATAMKLWGYKPLASEEDLAKELTVEDVLAPLTLR